MLRSVRPSWRVRVSQSVRDARIEVIGQQDVKNEAQADAVCAILRAYGDSPRGFLYVEPYLPKKVGPNDILLCHPDVGVLVVEIKAYRIADIARVVAGNLFVKTGGEIVPKVAPSKKRKRPCSTSRQRLKERARDQ